MKGRKDDGLGSEGMDVGIIRTFGDIDVGAKRGNEEQIRKQPILGESHFGYNNRSKESFRSCIHINVIVGPRRASCRCCRPFTWYWIWDK